MATKVRDAIKQVEAAGWDLARVRASHRQYRHPLRPGLVTIAGKPSDTLHPATWKSIMRQAGNPERTMTQRRYLIVIEGDESAGFSSYAPDLPGVVATGASRAECEREMRDAVAFHVDGLREAGEEIPEPSPVTTAYVDVAA